MYLSVAIFSQILFLFSHVWITYNVALLCYFFSHLFQRWTADIADCISSNKELYSRTNLQSLMDNLCMELLTLSENTFNECTHMYMCIIYMYN